MNQESIIVETQRKSNLRQVYQKSIMNANKINYLLREYGFNQSKIARIIGVPRSNVTEVIAGRRHTRKIQEAVARAINMAVEAVFPNGKAR